MSILRDVYTSNNVDSFIVRLFRFTLTTTTVINQVLVKIKYENYVK